MKKILLILMALIMSSSLIACSKENVKNENEDASEDSVMTETEGGDKEVGNSEGEKITDINETDPSNDSKEPVSSDNRVRFTDALKARHEANEPDGYSIWYRNDSTICVDSEGYECFRFDKGEDPVSDIKDGVVVISYDMGKNHRLRSAADAEILFDTGDEEGMSFVKPQSGVWYNDYFMVKSVTGDYKGTTTRLGFINNKGEWVVELSEDNALLSHGNLEAMRYRGEGILSFMDDGDYYLYDINKDSLNKIQTNDDINTDTIDSIFECCVPEFRDSFTAGYLNLKKVVYRIYSDGRLEGEKIKLDSRIESVTDVFYDAENDRVLIMDIESNALYDVYGDVIKDFGDMGISEFGGFNEDGKAQLLIANASGTYYTVMDCEGNFDFEPVKVTTDAIYDAEGNMIGDNYGETSHTVVDSEGNILLTTEPVYEFELNNGVVYYEGFMGRDATYTDLSE